MIIVDKYNRNPRYLINESAISFTENYQSINQGGPDNGAKIYDVVYVSIVSNAAIMVYDENNGISYGKDLQYQRWRLSGETTGLVSHEAHNIYARLNKTGKKDAMIVFSVRDYNTDGSYTYIDDQGIEQEVEASDAYYYIKIGTLSALSSPNVAIPDRVLTFDPGELSTQKNQNEQGGGWISEMFDLIVDVQEKFIRPLLRFEKIRVKGSAIFDSIVSFYKGFKFGDGDTAKEITSVATDLTTDEDSTTTIATPAYVKVFSEGRYLRYDIDTPQTVKGTVTFEKDLNVGGNNSVDGNQTIGGTQEVGGLQTLHVGFQTPNFNDAGGQIAGAQLTSAGLLTVAGLKAMSFEIFELIYNVIRAQGGTVTYSPCANIEQCVYVIDRGTADHPDVLQLTPDEYFANYDKTPISYVLLTIKKEEANKNAVPFRNADILYGYVNQIGESGQYARGGQCVMHVISPDDEIGLDGSMVIKAKLYSSAVTDNNGHQIVGNMPPTNGMTVAQRGNEKGTEGRTSAFFIDSIAGNIIMLQNITTPVISRGNYGIINGQLPDDLYNEVAKIWTIDRTAPVSYGKYAIFENFIQLDHFGKPIATENFRGQWSFDTVSGDNPYTVTEAIYDTVTHDGSLWKCLRTGTTEEPSYDSQDWLILVARGADGTSIKVTGTVDSIEKLPSNPNDGDGYIVGLDLHVWSAEAGEWINVGQFKGEDGKPQYLHIAYANKDAQGNITDFSTTDPSGRDYTGTSTSFNKEESQNPNDYTWKSSKGNDGKDGTNGESPQENLLTYSSDFSKDWYINEVVSIGDGLNGHKAITLAVQSQEPILIAGYQYVTKAPSKLVGSTWYTLSFYCKGTGTFSTFVTPSVVDATQHLIVDGVETTGRNDGGASFNLTSEWARHYVSFRTLPTMGNKGNVQLAFRAGAVGSVCMPKLELGVSMSPYRVNDYDLVGPAGDAGAMMQPQGKWVAGPADSDVYAYSLVTQLVDGKEVVIARPLVYYAPNDDDQGQYFLLQNNIKGRDNTVANLNNTAYWRRVDKYEALYVKILMANYAKLASAVFYSDYMFSDLGIVTTTGSLESHSEHIHGGTPMFINGRLSGSFSPQLFLDFMGGAAKMGKLFEPFYDLHYGGALSYKIDLGLAHNVKSDVSKVIFMPNPTSIRWDADTEITDTILEWEEREADGAHCMVVAKPNPKYTEKYKTPYAQFKIEDGSTTLDIDSAKDNMTLVCADGRLSDRRSYLYSSQGYGDSGLYYFPHGGLYGDSPAFGSADGLGYFLINGVPVKFIVLEPGATLKLRSCYTTAGRYSDPYSNTGEAKAAEGLYWIVENAADFEPISLNVSIYSDAYLGGVSESNGSVDAVLNYFGTNVYKYCNIACPTAAGGESLSAEIAYGSKFIRAMQGTTLQEAQNNPLNATFKLSDEGVSLLDDELWISNK